MHIRRLFLGHFRHHPHTAEVRDAVKLHCAFEMLSRSYVTSENESVRGRDYIDIFGQLAAIRDFSDLQIAHAQIAQAIGIALDTAYPLLGHHAWIRNGPVPIFSGSAGNALGGSEEP